MPLKIYESSEMGARPLTTFIYGAPRTGKTTMASTYPTPVFIAAGNEGGDTTLRFAPQNCTVIPVHSKADMEEAVKYIGMNHKMRGWQTVVVDSLTYYADIFVSELVKKSGKGQMSLKEWGLYDMHFGKWLLPSLHRLGLHVVWIALENHVKDSEGNILKTVPMMSGRTAEKMPAATDLICYIERTQIQDPNTKQFQDAVVARTTPTLGRNFIAGGRFGNHFADGWVAPHFGAIAQRIGPWIGVNSVPVVAPGNQQSPVAAPA